ncbi:MAG: carboxymuconolactone decarboxylase family protein [Ilumatobacteraceae bacterium]
MSEHRIDYTAFKPGLDSMFKLGKAVHDSGLEAPLLELVKTRASQINSCAFCLDMHWKDARANGETEQRLYGLSAWREAPYYTDRERAALGLTEAVTRLADRGVPDEVIAAAQPHFSPEELAALIYAIVSINSWNRLAVSARSLAGSYVVGAY